MAQARNIFNSWHENQNYIPKVNTGDSVMETDGIRGDTTKENIIQNGKISPSTAYRFGITGAILALAESKNIIHIARDNRSSSPYLLDAAINGALDIGVNVKVDGENGISTTPQCGNYARNDKSAGAAIVITGSHNPEHQNGLKLFDKKGKKVSPKWERITDRIINAKELRKEINKIAMEERISLLKINKGKTILQPNIDDKYVKNTIESVKEILNFRKKKKLNNILFVLDAANGSGSKFAQKVAKELSELNIALINTGEGIINKDCGANYIFNKNMIPIGLKIIKDAKTNNSLIKLKGYNPQPLKKVELWSIDGDNDRNIAYYFDSNGNLSLIDGNKIAAYIIRCIKKNIDQLGFKLNLGYVMTVVGNKAAKEYVEEKLGIPVVRTKVGDKNTRSAAEKFNIGVYYEDTGHGAIHFSNKAKKTIKNLITTSQTEEISKSILLAMMNLQNESCGDGIRNSLLVKALMEQEDWGIEAVGQIYKDYPKCLVHVSIENKNALITKNNLGLNVIKPKKVKETVNRIMQELGNDYEHVTRPSGTEQYIKVQVQGPNESKVEETAYRIAQAVYDNTQIIGKGEKPINIWKEKTSKKINPNIFKEYDIRGLAAKDLTDEKVYLLGCAFGTLVRRIKGEAKEFTVSVGRDVRLSSPRISKNLIKGIRDSGVNVIDVGICPIEVSYFSVPYLDILGAVMITASHNTKEWNGLKPLIGLLNMSSKQGQELKCIAEEEDFLKGKGKLQKKVITDEYIEMVKADIRLGGKKWHEMVNNFGLQKAIEKVKSKKLKSLPFKGLEIITDTGNGAVGDIAKRIYQELGAEVDAINVKRDGNFPSHKPDIFGYDSQKDIINAMKKKKYNAGFLFDGDGDRLQTFSPKIKNPEGDLILCILEEPILKELPKSKVVFEVNCSNALTEHTKALGGVPIEWNVGHTIIRLKLFEEKAPIGGEVSGHFYFYDNFLFDDAIFAGAKLLDILAKSEEDLDQMLNRLPQYINSPQLRFSTPDEERSKIITQLKKSYKKRGITIDEKEGAKIIFDKLNGWYLIRESNTNPELSFKAEAKSQKGYNAIILDAYNELKKYNEIDLSQIEQYIKELGIV